MHYGSYFFGCLVVSGSAKHTGKRFSHSKREKFQTSLFSYLPLSGSLGNINPVYYKTVRFDNLSLKQKMFCSSNRITWSKKIINMTKNECQPNRRVTVWLNLCLWFLWWKSQRCTQNPGAKSKVKRKRVYIPNRRKIGYLVSADQIRTYGLTTL